MAIFPQTLCVASTFICERQEQAGVRAKRAAEHVPRPWSSRPHIRLEMYVGTHETHLNRVSAHHYAGHMPDAPILLGAGRTAAYRASAAATDMGGGRGTAILKAAALGAVIGLAVATFSLAFVFLLMKAGVPGALTWSGVAALFLFDVGILAGMLSYMEARDYRDACQRFTDLADLSDGYDRLVRAEWNEAVENRCRALVERGYGGREWSLRHAAAEYDQEMQVVMARRREEARKAA